MTELTQIGQLSRHQWCSSADTNGAAQQTPIAGEHLFYQGGSFELKLFCLYLALHLIVFENLAVKFTCELHFDIDNGFR